MGPLGQHQVVVGLEGPGPVSAVADVDETAVDRTGLVGHGPLEQQLALGPGRVVILESPEIVDL